MARPRKDDLSPEEWAAIEGKGDRAASGIVSALRGADVASISQREASRRSVSHEWVAQQRKKRQKTQPSENPVAALTASPSENPELTDDTGTRIGREETSGGCA
jgi:hypothetical protein